MPFLTKESLAEITAQVREYYRGKKRHEREDAYTLTYGSEDSYHMTTDYHGLFAEGIMPEDVEKGMNGGKWNVQEQLEKNLAFAERTHAEGKKCDVVVFIPKRYCFNDVWSHAAEIDADAAEAHARSLAAKATYYEAKQQPDDLAALKAAAETALAAVPEGANKEDCLPFVEATLKYWDAKQAAALDADDTAASFEAAEEQIQYQRDYERLRARTFYRLYFQSKTQGESHYTNTYVRHALKVERRMSQSEYIAQEGQERAQTHLHHFPASVKWVVFDDAEGVRGAIVYEEFASEEEAIFFADNVIKNRKLLATVPKGAKVF
jgi:hypothetical protein